MTEFEGEQRIIKAVSGACSIYLFWRELPVRGRDVFRSVMVDLVTEARKFKRYSELSNNEILSNLHVPLADARVVVVFNDAFEMAEAQLENVAELQEIRGIYRTNNLLQ